jgi:Flp pilus assembly protein TadG
MKLILNESESLPANSVVTRARQHRKRTGNIVLLSAFLMVMVFGFVAFTIDLGYVALAKGQLQNAVDAATLAAAMELNPNEDQAVVKANVEAAVIEVAGMNPVGPEPGLGIDPTNDIELGRRDWDSVNNSWVFNFSPAATPYNIVRVTGRLAVLKVDNGVDPPYDDDRRLPLFFAPVLGHDKVQLEVGSIATFQPRDLMLVLDYSGSMNDDTEFKSVGSLGQTTVENAITTIWHELGDPAYGTMPFTPEYLTVTLPASGALPEVTITYKGTEVYITSTANIDQVKLGFSGGHEDFPNLTGTTGTFQGVADHAGQRIDHVHVWSGDRSDEKVNFSDSDIRDWLSLGTYPHPSGSWTDFINYVNTSGNVNQAGFRYKYGTMCLINYWNEKRAKNSQTPGLWVCSTQPLNAAKNASDVLIDYIADVEADDQVGLTIYTHSSSDGALTEIGLTSDPLTVKPYYRQRQASHYDALTNIGAGIKEAREELVLNGRQDAVWVMVLMTDGVANRPSGYAEQYALDQADLCKTAKIKIMTISLGVNADTGLMQGIADATGGEHFNVPGGGTIAEYEQQLKDVFQAIAADRPLKLLPSQ